MFDFYCIFLIMCYNKMHSLEGNIMENINKTACDAINVYIDNFLTMPSNDQEAFRIIDNLSHYFKHMGYVLTMEDAKDILNNNIIIKTSMKLIVDKNPSLFSLSGINFNNGTFYMFLKAYKHYASSNDKYELNDLFEMLLASDDNYDVYKKTVTSMPNMSKKEELELGTRLLKGDKKAREAFILRNLKLVIPYAEHYQTEGVSIFDIIQEGNLGLINAVDNYDVNKGIRFYFYASPAINRNICKALSQKYKSIRIPYWLDMYKDKMEQTKEELAVKLGRIPTNSEIEELIGKRTFSEHAYVGDSILSLDTSIDDEDLLSDLIASDEPTPEQITMQKSLENDIQEILDTVLTEREKEIVLLKVGFKEGYSRTLEAIADKFNLTDSRVSQIYETAIKKLIQYRKTMNLAVYTESPVTAKENLMQRKWEFAKERLNYESIDALIDVLRNKLKDINLDSLINYYCPAYIKMISLFMGFNGYCYNSKRLSTAMEMNLRTLRSCLIDIYSIYENQIVVNKLSRKKNENNYN